MIVEEARLKRLFLAGLRGDAAAERDFLKETAALLRGYFRRRLRSAPEEAEDVLQETLIALHTRRDAFDPALPITPWIHAIARYRLIDHWRRKQRRGVTVPLDAEGAEALFEAPVAEASDARRDIAVLLAHLPEKQRRAITLVKLEDKSVKEAAALTGWSESDIKVSIHRGLRALAALMQETAP